jgi:hypothetical protein
VGEATDQLVEAGLCIVRQPQQPPGRLPLLAHVGLRAVPPGGGVGGALVLHLSATDGRPSGAANG